MLLEDPRLRQAAEAVERKDRGDRCRSQVTLVVDWSPVALEASDQGNGIRRKLTRRQRSSPRVDCLQVDEQKAVLLCRIVKVNIGVEAADEKPSLATLRAVITRLRDKVLGFKGPESDAECCSSNKNRRTCTRSAWRSSSKPD